MIIFGHFPSFSQTILPRVKRIGHLSGLSFHLINAFLLALGFGMMAMEYDGHRTLWQDFKIRNQYKVIEDAEVSRENYCFNTRGMVTTCRIAFRYQGIIYQQTLQFFASRADSLPPLKIIQGIDKPEIFSTDFALKKLMSRSLNAMFFMGVGLFLIGLCVWIFLVLSPFYRRVLRGLNSWSMQPWQIVGLSDWQFVNDQYVLHLEENGKIRRIIFQNNHLTPWVVGEYMLAVVPKHGGLPAPLDTQLKVIGGLTRAQKERCKRHIQQIVHQKQ